MVEEQYERVYRVINENLEYFVRKEYEEFKNKGKIAKPKKCYCYGDSKDINFPSFKATFEKLIQQGKVGSKRYEEIKKKIKAEVLKIQVGLFTKKESQLLEVSKSEHSAREAQSKKVDQGSQENTNLSRNPPSPTLSSNNSHNASFDSLPLLTD
jgi:hypothetical protein